jgi:hypothetical protein
MAEDFRRIQARCEIRQRLDIYLKEKAARFPSQSEREDMKFNFVLDEIAHVELVLLDLTTYLKEKRTNGGRFPHEES